MKKHAPSASVGAFLVVVDSASPAATPQEALPLVRTGRSRKAGT